MQIAIVGGGIGGLTAAIALQQRGFSVRVHEAAASWQPVGKGIWLPTNAFQALDRLSLSALLTSRGCALAKIEILDCRDGLLQQVDLRLIAEWLGYTTLSIRRADLHHVLCDHLLPGTCQLDRRCTGFSQDEQRVTIHFADGSETVADLLIGADGLHSIIRQTLFPGIAVRYSGQTCLRGIASFTLPPPLAHTCQEWWDGTHRFGFSALDERHVYWFAPLLAPAGGSETLTTLQLAKRYAAFPQPVPTLLYHTPPAEIILTDLYETDLYELPPLPCWWQRRVVLLGDAAHAMMPNLGQGGAQAIEDAIVLADCLSKLPLFETLHAYEQTRRPRVERIARAARLFGQIAHVRSGHLQWLRNRIVRLMPALLSQRQLNWLYQFRE